MVYDGFIMPARETLGDRDETPVGDRAQTAQPEDPWQHPITSSLQHTDTAELFTFVTTSKTGRRAVGTLLRHYDRLRVTHPGELPVVQLRTGGFSTTTRASAGWPSPAFVVVGRQPADGVAKPDDTPMGALLDDEITVYVAA